MWHLTWQKSPVRDLWLLATYVIIDICSHDESKCIALILTLIIMSTVTCWEESHTWPVKHHIRTIHSLFYLVFKSSKKFASHIWVQLGWRCQRYVSPLVSRSVDLVCFNISPLYQIISSHQFYQLSYYIPHFKRDLCREHHVRDPESTRRNSWFLIIDNHVKNKKYMSFVSISSLTGECAAQK